MSFYIYIHTHTNGIIMSLFPIGNSIDNFKSDITDINPPPISSSSSQQKLNLLPYKRIGVNSYYGMIEINKKDRLLLLEKLNKKKPMEYSISK